MAETDEQLVRLRRPLRSAEGFVELYRRESGRVLTFCARRVLEAEAAVDLTAETFAQAYRGRCGFRGDTEVEARAWLFSIARRQISRYLRKGALDRRATEALGIRVPVVDEGDTEEIERRAGLPALRAALAPELARLSEEQQVALRLRVVEERSYEEIADELGVSEQTVRARVSRGLRALGRALETNSLFEGGTT